MNYNIGNGGFRHRHMPSMSPHITPFPYNVPPPPIMRGMPRRGTFPGSRFRGPPMNGIPSQPEMVSYEVNHEFNGRIVDSNSAFNNSSQVSLLVCDSCDLDFPSEVAFNKHMSEHKVCGLDGCSFSAHKNIIEEHIQTQHSTGIFKKMKDSDSPEDVAKWREMRKSMYPSKENREKRLKEKEELFKKGIRIGERNNKFGKDKKRLERKDPQIWRKEREMFFKKKTEKRNTVIQKMRPKLLIDEKSDWNNELPPFMGIKELFEVEDEETSKISDDEDYTKKPTKIEELVKVNSSLAALMSYGSDYSEDDDEVMKNNVKNENKDMEKKICEIELVDISVQKENKEEFKEMNSDNDAPLEIKIEKTITLFENEKVEKLSKPINGRKLKSRNRGKKAGKNNDPHKFPYEFRTRKISLLEKILDEDIRQERNLILHCVRHTVENNFFMNTPTAGNKGFSDTPKETC